MKTTTTTSPTLRPVLATGAALLVLWGSSWALSSVALGGAALPVAIAIAVAKALLVALVFMELAKEAFSIRITLAVACVLAALLLGLMVADVVTRDPAPFTPP